MPKIVGIKFRKSPKIYYFEAGKHEYKENCGVIVETARGTEFGELKIMPTDVEEDKIVSPLKKITPHKLRSTFGTNLYRQTGDIYAVADCLGHKDVNTTKRHYAAISEDIRKKAALSLDISNKNKND